MRTLRFTTLLCCALVFGLTLSHVLQAPGSKALSGPSWLQVQQTFYGGFAVVGGLAEILGLISTVIIVIRLRHIQPTSARPFAVAALCLLGALAAYLLGNRPANAQIAGWTPHTLPQDWATYRDQWETAHAVAAALSGVALIVLLLSAFPCSALDRPPGRRADASATQGRPL